MFDEAEELIDDHEKTSQPSLIMYSEWTQLRTRRKTLVDAYLY